MQNIGTSASSLAERVKAKAEQERQEMESLTRQQFSALSESLRQSSQNALSITEAAILAQLGNLESSISSRSRTLNLAFGWTCLRGLLLSLSILTGAGLGGWGLITLAGKQVSKLRSEITVLSERKAALEVESTRIWATFKGLEPLHSEGKDYLLTPEGWTIINSGMAGKRDAWRIVRK
ncbi:hypothetical protein [uncultured Desulfovibrio sp.]|uniref:hypothetical protein n=1 Tax=uncultured Desulfovibrio sp. TaxID=167968 RepID=UPI002621C7CD|nr:hypothetical protein [uncultured Desulfovibrio sp.]